MEKRSLGYGVFVFWVLFYVVFFSVFTFGIALIFYAITIPFAFSAWAEILWRKLSGVRPLRLRSEKQRLYPLFSQVYQEAEKSNPDLNKDIGIYIKEDMDINAYAFGRRTLVLTRGSIELLNDDCLKGLIAHELGHFANKDTIMFMLYTVGNLFLSLILEGLNKMRRSRNGKGSIISVFFNILYIIPRGIQYIGDLILMRYNRRHEYMADAFAVNSGFGSNLADVLIQIYQVSIEKPQTIKEQLKSTHPPITKRIEEIEKVIY